MSDLKYPQKKYFRQRAHSNPLSDHVLEHPASPDLMNWEVHYPKYFSDSSMKNSQVEIVDIGCGYGGLLVKLASMMPQTLMLGLELRIQVSNFVIQRIKKLRSDAEVNKSEVDYQNISCLRANAMKHIPNFFKKGQLKKAFILFPDPHFKRQNLRRRVVSPLLLSEYAYVLAEGALVYIITDVKDVYDWIVSCFTDHQLFVRVSDEENKKDPCFEAIYISTEEGKKVTRNGSDKFSAVFRRLPNPS